MRVRLADVGDPLSRPMFGVRRDIRARSMRDGEGGDGGGTNSDPPDDGDNEDETDEDEEEEKDEKDPNDLTDLGDPATIRKKVQKYNERDKALRASQAKVRELEEKLKNGDDEEDPVAQANERIIRTATHGILRGLGITDKDDRTRVIDMLRLSDITVDKDGADEDEIEERLDELRELLAPKVREPRKRTPRVDTRDKGGSEGESTDSDKKRYARILGKHR